MSDEETDELGPLDQENGVVPLIDTETLQQVMLAKKADPSAFCSYWEMDEQDIQEATDEQIQNDPVLRTLWAAETGNIEVLKEMLKKDATLVRGRDQDGYTALHRAGYENQLEAIQILLEAGADIDAKTNDGWTPLHSACRWDQTDAAAKLLECGASINMQTNGGQTPLHLTAVHAETKQTLELLLMYPDIDVTVKNRMGESAQELCERANPFAYLFEVTRDYLNKLPVPEKDEDTEKEKEKEKDKK